MSRDIILTTATSFAAAQIITDSAPAITGDTGAGQTVSITWGTYRSARAPAGTERKLYLNDVDVTANMSGDDYTIPSDAPGGFELRVAETPLFGEGERQISKPETVAVQGIAPTITASDSLSGRTLTITVDSTTGIETPVTALMALTLDGVDVLGDETGTGPWEYEVPDNYEPSNVHWTVEASDGNTIVSTSGSVEVPADQFAPTILTAPSFSGTVEQGATITIIKGTYEGSPDPVSAGDMTLNGVDVTDNMVGDTYTIPPETPAGQELTWSEIGDNGITPSPDLQVITAVVLEAEDTAAPTVQMFTMTAPETDVESPTVKFTAEYGGESAWARLVFTFEDPQAYGAADAHFIFDGLMADGLTPAPIVSDFFQVVSGEERSVTVNIAQFGGGTVYGYLALRDEALNFGAPASASYERVLTGWSIYVVDETQAETLSSPDPAAAPAWEITADTETSATVVAHPEYI